MKVTKAVIPAAGLGTRLKPATDFYPKELLPIGTRPSLFFLLDEIEQSGLKEVILVVSREKKPLLSRLQEFYPRLQFQFPIQKEPKGLGDAVSVAESAVGGEAFLVLLPDIIIDHPKPAALQLIEVFQKTGKAINATEHSPKELLQHYGVYKITSSDGRLHHAAGVIEKPAPGEAPSDLTVIGRYLFTPEIFGILKTTKPGRNGEIQLADAMDTLAKKRGLDAFEFEGVHLDCGHPEGYLRTVFYLGQKEYGKSFYKEFE